MQHKWHKEIKAWADGAEIEARTTLDDGTYTDWHKISTPFWETSVEYRIKPQPKEPQYLYVWFAKDTEEVVFEFEPPAQVLEDAIHKYIGKIKLEQDDE